MPLTTGGDARGFGAVDAVGGALRAVRPRPAAARVGARVDERQALVRRAVDHPRVADRARRPRGPAGPILSCTVRE